MKAGGKVVRCGYCLKRHPFVQVALCQKQEIEQVRFFRRHPSKLPSVLKAEENMTRLREMKKIPVDPRLNQEGLRRAREVLRERQLA